ncbi:MAG: cellobiose phosphorylase [Spirochaetales bacterium]|nr:cellobiose phosphorylase [Spirochaetales bacterium]
MPDRLESTLRFTDKTGTFQFTNPDLVNDLYFPLANEAGMMAAITPELHGDLKTGQEKFLLAPVSSYDLHNSRAARNFWFLINGKEPYSVSGNSAVQKSEKFSDNRSEQVTVEAGLLWHRLKRTHKKLAISTEVLSFVPCSDLKAELMEVTITNTGSKDITAVPTAAIPFFNRSADNIRDHRHVTSLLNTIAAKKYGVSVHPTLSFDERGHTKNEVTYEIMGADGDGNPPEGFFPVAEDFIGEGGSFDWPEAVIRNRKPAAAANEEYRGYEAMAGLRFKLITLKPGESHTYRLIMHINDDGSKEDISRFLTGSFFAKELDKNREYWRRKVDDLSFSTGNADFDNWMKWVTLQPILRRIYGCSFLPHHDYGRGGRGWRDLWQDCLALLIMEPDGVRGLLFNNFAGVRIDGSNATIIGLKPGEFLADRNNIPRVWMDHGSWPFLTTKLYIDQSGDLDFLLEEQVYFKDANIGRCTARDEMWTPEQGTKLQTKSGEVYKGTILEHMLIQHLSVFFNAGEHNNLLLEGADWNDAFDMARNRGESVAFSALYAADLAEMARLLEGLKTRKNVEEIEIAGEITALLDTISGKKIDYSSHQARRKVLREFFSTIKHTLTGEKVKIRTDHLVADLEAKSRFLMEHIRKSEWIEGPAGSGWFNGYYDDDGQKLEGMAGNEARMTLTGQVFTVMGGTATREQVDKIIKAVDQNLWSEELGGPRLNTDFRKILLNMGRCFGFAFGHKENGAVFNHMVSMYANALYTRGYAAEGYRIMKKIFTHSSDFSRSKFYPGISEYINPRGRGMYHYLTGSASWYLLTVLTRMFGVQGFLGDLSIKPALAAEQFDANHSAGVRTLFAGIVFNITFKNIPGKECYEYRIKSVSLDGKAVDHPTGAGEALIKREDISRLDKNSEHSILVELE